jgi:hypothetical protein
MTEESRKADRMVARSAAERAHEEPRMRPVSLSLKEARRQSPAATDHPASQSTEKKGSPASTDPSSLGVEGSDTNLHSSEVN